MLTGPAGPDIGKSALVIVDMQNDFGHPDGGFAHLARERPEAAIDMPFLMSTVPHVKRLAEAFRRAGRPLVYVTQVLRSDYSDAAFPYWRATKGSTSGNRTLIVEGTWGAHEAELKTMARIFADVKSSDEVIAMLAEG